MTREEAIKELKILKEEYWDDDGYGHETKQYDDTMLALDMAIKVLAQEPCEDAVSRQAIIDEMEKRHAEGDCITKGFVKNLPSVTPQEPKTGHWIEEINDYGEVTGWHCDKCYEDSGFTTTCKWDFCPKCGAKMVEPQESEDNK